MVRHVLAAALLLAIGGTSGSATGALNSNGWTALGRDRLGSADQLGAIQAADRALQMDANNVRAIELRGELVRSQFGLVAALIWFERGLQIDPDNVSLLEEYGATLGEAGRYRDMLRVARRIISLDSRNPRAFYMQAVLAARAGDYALAKRILPLAGDAFNEIPGPMLLDAICEYELGNYNLSVDKLQRLVSMQPGNLTVRTYTRPDCLFMSGASQVGSTMRLSRTSQREHRREQQLPNGPDVVCKTERHCRGARLELFLPWGCSKRRRSARCGRDQL